MLRSLFFFFFFLNFLAMLYGMWELSLLKRRSPPALHPTTDFTHTHTHTNCHPDSQTSFLASLSSGFSLSWQASFSSCGLEAHTQFFDQCFPLNFCIFLGCGLWVWCLSVNRVLVTCKPFWAQGWHVWLCPGLGQPASKTRAVFQVCVSDGWGALFPWQRVYRGRGMEFVGIRAW